MIRYQIQYIHCTITNLGTYEMHKKEIDMNIVKK